MPTMHRSLVFAIGVALLAACSSAPTSGPVTITHELDVTQNPIVGTFEVTEGADVLGCSAGTFVDDPGIEAIGRVMTCTDEGTGTFTYSFIPEPPSGADTMDGTWTIDDGTGDFSGVSGSGEWSAGGLGMLSETISGTIEHTP